MRGIGQDIDGRFMARQVDLVPDAQHGHAFRKARHDGVVAAGRTATGVQNMQHDIGISDCCPSAQNADALYLAVGLVGFANAGGVDDVDRDAFDMNGFGNFVAGSAGDRRDDGDVGTGERI